MCGSVFRSDRPYFFMFPLQTNISFCPVNYMNAVFFSLCIIIHDYILCIRRLIYMFIYIVLFSGNALQPKAPYSTSLD